VPPRAGRAVRPDRQRLLEWRVKWGDMLVRPAVVSQLGVTERGLVVNTARVAAKSTTAVVGSVTSGAIAERTWRGELTERVHEWDVSAARVAENQARFREINERIRTAAERGSMELMPVVCECADVDCRQILRLPLAEYEAIRASGRRFLNARGHEDASAGWANVIEVRDGYVVVEKVGEAGQIAEELDPREDGESGRA
jgi:hypothetical protein